MHVIELGAAGITDGAESRLVTATSPDGQVRLSVLRHSVPSVWDALEYAADDEPDVRRQVPGLTSLARVREVDRWSCSWVLDQGEVRDGTSVLVVHCAHGGLAHRLIAALRPEALGEREEYVSLMHRLASRLPDAGLDAELTAGGVLMSALWVGRADCELGFDDATPTFLRDLVEGILAARLGAESRLTWLDPDLLTRHLELRPTEDEVEVRVLITHGWTPERPPTEHLAGRTSWRSLAAGVALGLRRVLDQEDAVGVRAEWVRSWFPVALLDQLLEAVEAEPPPLCLDLPEGWSLERR